MSPDCRTCGDHVSALYVRVLGDDDGAVDCPWCSPSDSYILADEMTWASAGAAPL